MKFIQELLKRFSRTSSSKSELEKSEAADEVFNEGIMFGFIVSDKKISPYLKIYHEYFAKLEPHSDGIHTTAAMALFMIILELSETKSLGDIFMEYLAEHKKIMPEDIATIEEAVHMMQAFETYTEGPVVSPTDIFKNR